MSNRDTTALDTREQKPFDADSARYGGYLYTTNQSLSSKIAVDRQTEAMLAAYAFAGRSVLDVGCGDANATIELFDRAAPSQIDGIDPAANAIDVGKSRIGNRRIKLTVASAYDLPFPDNHFDVAHLRGVLHHMDTPALAVKEAARVARTVAILEPNGYNPVLKAIEKFSAYHRSHGERSFVSGTVDRWLTDAGLHVTYRNYCGLVPYFCPDIMARALRLAEPLVEAMPGIRVISCGAYVAVGSRA